MRGYIQSLPVIIAAIMLGAWVPNVWAVPIDSATVGPPALSNAAGGKRNMSPYLLAEGYADVNNNFDDSEALFGAPGWARTQFAAWNSWGYGANYLCDPPSATRPPLCKVLVKTRKGVATKLAGSESPPSTFPSTTSVYYNPCSKGYSARVFLTPVGGGGMYPAVACPLSQPYVLTASTSSEVIFRAQVTGEVYSNDGNYKPAVSFYWKIMCIPDRVYGQNDSFGTTVTTDTLVVPDRTGTCDYATGIKLPILLWDTGTFTPNSPTVLGLQRDFTHRQCPKGYIPYIQIGLGNILPTDQGENQPIGTYAPKVQYTRSPSFFGVCVNRIRTNYGTAYGPRYEVFFMSRVNYRQFSQVRLSTGQAYNNVQEPMDVPSGLKISDMKSIPWQLYCYPPDTASPQSAIYNVSPIGTAEDTSCTYTAADYD